MFAVCTHSYLFHPDVSLHVHSPEYTVDCLIEQAGIYIHTGHVYYVTGHVYHVTGHVYHVTGHVYHVTSEKWHMIIQKDFQVKNHKILEFDDKIGIFEEQTFLNLLELIKFYKTDTSLGKI